MPSTYAGCGCTALTPAYGRPTFVPSNPRGYGAEDDKPSSGPNKVLLFLGGFAFLYALHKSLGGFDAPPPTQHRSTPISVAPRKYRLPR